MTLERMNVLLNEKIMNLQVKISKEANNKTLNYKIYQQQLKDAQCLKKDINEDFDYDSSEMVYEYRYEKLNRPIL